MGGFDVLVINPCEHMKSFPKIFLLYPTHISLLIMNIQGVQTKLSRNYFVTKNNIKCTFLNFLLKNQKQVLGSYLFNKITVSLNNGLVTASEPDEGSYNHVSVHDGEYLDDGGHQDGLDALSKSFGMSPKYAGDKIAHKHKI